MNRKRALRVRWGVVFTLLFFLIAWGVWRARRVQSPVFSGFYPASAKQGVGASVGTLGEKVSRVVFTLAEGRVTEVFFPRVDTVQLAESQILIWDGKRLEKESVDLMTQVEREPGALIYRAHNQDKRGRFYIEKTIWVDAEREALFQRIEIHTRESGLHFYYYEKSEAANTLFGDTARAEDFSAGETLGKFSGWHRTLFSVPLKSPCVQEWEEGEVFLQWDDSGALKCRPEKNRTGSLSLVGELDTPSSPGQYTFLVVTVFGTNRTEMEREAEGALDINPKKSQALLAQRWHAYLKPLQLPQGRVVSKERSQLSETSLLMLKAAEDKTLPGAIVASPSLPWGNAREESFGSSPSKNFGYHVVWPRDLCHMANGFLAANDTDTAISIFHHLRKVQGKEGNGVWPGVPGKPKRRGSFAQNHFVDGDIVYAAYQADETAMPILLAVRLWKQKAITAQEAWTLTEPASQFLSALGPWTEQDRWEEIAGHSPLTTAYFVAALTQASLLASALGHAEQASRYAEVARDALKSWENVAFPRTKENTAVDAGFLAFVRLGLRLQNDPFILNSIEAVDRTLKRSFPGGEGWYRYSGDRYGEAGRGRLWPLLNGERLHFELGRASAEKLLEWTQHYEALANANGIFSEQVWDEGPNAGKATGSSAPLLWAHAEYLQWLRSWQDQRVFERPQ